jgi:NitT/TauT family transport system substrate-binding protein
MRAFARMILAAALTLSLAGPAIVRPALGEVNEVRLTRQPGLLYLPLMIMEHEKFIEKQAKSRGNPDLKVSWFVFNSGGAAVDALLSGNVDFVTSGCSNLLVAWSASGGKVKGVGGAGAVPMILVTRNPNVKSLKDFTSADKIAVPTVRVSMQAVMMQMESEKEFGLDQIRKMDPITVAMGHPDAYAALSTGKGEIDAHFSLPPYEQEELKLPGVHAVIDSIQIAGGPVSNGVVFSSVAFHDKNPATYAAVLAALRDAQAFIQNNKRAAAQIYLDQTHEKLTLDQLVAIMNLPNMLFTVAPQRTGKVADTMYKAGSIKMKAASWRDFFFSEVHNEKGSS